MHPSIKNAFDKRTHPLINHPVHGVYGKDLAMASYEHLKNKYKESTGSDEINMREMLGLLDQAIKLEEPHKEELEKTAIEIVKKVWGIEDEIDVSTNLGSDVSFELSDYEPKEPEDNELTPEEKKQVDKRITMNVMTHGAALHQMITMHHLATDVLNNINPNLVKIYDKIARGSQYSTWFINLEQFLRMLGQQGGEVKIEFPEGDDIGNIEIKASAICFPILLHEISKGVMEVLTAHGLPKDPVLLKKVYKHADRPEHEFLHYLVGPELWRRFIKVVGKRKISDVIASLSSKEPDEVHKIIGMVVDNPQEAEELIDALIENDEPDDFDKMLKDFEDSLNDEEL